MGEFISFIYGLLITYLLPVIVFGVISLGLFIAALIHMFKHEKCNVGNRTIWIIVCVLFGALGSILYFFIGSYRPEDPEEGFPNSFWVALAGSVSILMFSALDWFTTTVTYGYQTGIYVKFNFFMLFGNFDNTGLYFIQGSPLVDAESIAQNMNLYMTTRIFTISSLVILIAGLILLLISLINYRKPFRVVTTLVGFSLTALSPVIFVFYFIFATGETTASGLTLAPLVIIAIALVSMLYTKDIKDIKHKKTRKFIHQRAFLFMTVPIVVYVFVFNYLPLTGWAMAFQDFLPSARTQEWVGFEHFRFMFNGFRDSPAWTFSDIFNNPSMFFNNPAMIFDNAFIRVMRNTLAMSVINLVLSFTTAIILALLINEIRQKLFKRTVQTISYLPHFLSWVIAAGIIGGFLTSDGILNDFLRIVATVALWVDVRLPGDGLFFTSILQFFNLPVFDENGVFVARIFRSEPGTFWWIIGWGNVWKSVGWNTIIYLAAITSIDPELYESAELDGAGRFAKMRYITLPGIKSTILVLLIMSIGWILNAGFEPQYLLGNVLVRTHSETIDIAVLRYGIENYNYSLATALGMFKTVVSIILITGANWLSKRIAKESIV